MKKLKIFFSLFFLVCFLLAKPALAADQKYLTIVNPIRGGDFFQLPNQQPIDNVKKELDIIRQNSLVATWLVRPDALQDKDIIQLLKNTSSDQEIGLFMEVTPTWAKLAGVNYRQSQAWHFAGSVLLTGYEVEERHKLIDAAFGKFKEVFGFYPKSVGAWWIDAGSLDYMREKYGILANLDVADQYTTDNYQVWGQYFSTPFYPSKRNALVPASGVDQKIGVVTIQWAARDPFNSYGNGVLDSTYSVQANDYANSKYHNLNTDYFKKLISIYLNNPYTNLTQVTVGMENDFSWGQYGAQYSRQIETVKNLTPGVKTVTMSNFASIYKAFYPTISPEVLIVTKDPLESSAWVVWFQSPKYRVGWFSADKGSVVKDLRLFREAQDEPCLLKACDKLNLAMTESRNIDYVTYGDQWVIDEAAINNLQVKLIKDGMQITYTNQLGVSKTLQFLPNDIVVNGILRPIPVVIQQEVDLYRNPTKLEYHFSNNLDQGLFAVLKDQSIKLVIFMVVFLAFIYLTGLTLLHHTQLADEEKNVLSYVVGISAFTLFSFLLGYLKVPGLVWVLPFISTLILKKAIFSVFLKIYKNIKLWLIIFLGSLFWLLTTVKNGLVYDYGIGFWGPHGHDALWHLAIIESLKKGLPAANPLFSGSLLLNYHYFYDLLLAQLSLISRIPAIDLYFRFIPLILSVLTGFVVYILAKEWFNSEKAGYLSVFFIYFGGSFGWMLTFIKDRTIGGETTFWAQQAVSTLINPPFAISIPIFLAGLFLFDKVIEQKSRALPLIIPLIILWGTLIEFKAYVGILVLISLAIATLTQLIKKKWNMLKISLPIVFLSMAVFLPNNLTGESLLVFSPFWLIHSMIDFPDRLHFMRLSYSRIANLETNNWLKFIGVEIVGLLIFIIGNLGSRILGVLALRKKTFVGTSGLFISTFLITSLIITLLFIQKGANFNSIQFLYYFILMFNFLVAYTVSRMNGLFIFVIILVTIPTTYGTLQHYLPARPPARISKAEIAGLDFLKKQPDGVVLSFYYNDQLKLKFTEPKPLFVYASTAYVSAFASKPEYISDTVNLDILGIDYKGRLQLQKDIFAQKDPELIKQLLNKAKIGYIYAPFLSNFHPDKDKYGLSSIFKNDEVEIFKVD